jgi:ribosome-interacting GTPase 1
LTSITNAKPKVSPFQYTTKKPIPGMLPYQDVYFQLVEVPALVEGASEGKMKGSQVLGMARNADGLIIMIDLSRNAVKQLEILSLELEKAGIIIEKPAGEVEITRRSFGSGIQITGGGVLIDCTSKDIKKMLKNYRITSALIRIRGKISLEDLENSLFSKTIYKPAIIIANKTDYSGADEKLLDLKENLNTRNIPLIAISCKNNHGLDKLGKEVFRMLRIMRIYTKEPLKKEPSEKPIVVEEGTRIIEVAKKLSNEIFRKFKYSRIWGPSAKYQNIKVGSEHILKDGDIIEIH